MKSFIHILHLEDNPADAELIQATLESADLTCQITRVQTRDEFSQALRQRSYDVIFGDYRLPTYDGLSALRLSLARCPETPFIFISGTMGEDAAIEGLTEGATDYVLKHKLSRLVPAVTRALREAENRKERQRAEAALRDSEARYRRITEAITDYLYMVRVVEGQAVETRHGPGCLAVTGYTEEEFAADPNLWIRMVVADDRPAVQDQAWRILVGEPTPAIEHRIVRKDGVVRWVCNTPVPRRDEQGVLLSYDGLIQDITGRKQAERDLQRSNDLLRAIIEAAPTAIIGLDLDGNVQMVWNPAAEKMLGWSAQEVMGHLLPSVPVESQEEFRRFREWIRSGKTLDGVEVRWQKRDGSPIDYSIYASPLHDAEGQIIGNIAVLVDIGERKRMEEQLRETHAVLERRVKDRTRELSEANVRLQREIVERQAVNESLRQREEELRSLLDNSPDMILKTDPHLRVIWANRTAMEINRNCIGMPCYRAFPGRDESCKGCPVARAIETKRLERGVMYQPISDTAPDEQYWENIGVPQFDESGEVIACIEISRNITDRMQITKKLEAANKILKEAKDAAEAANRAKSKFLANMSHELRTPLNAILGYAQLLKRETNLTATQQEQLTTIHSSGQHLVTLISDLLDLGRIEAQRMDVEVTTFNLPALLRNILDASRLKAETKSLFVRYEEVSPVPALVRGDDRKLRQVLLNLLDNAIKYTETGGVTLRVSSQQSPVTSHQSPVAANCQLPTANLLFEVEDTGIGISEEQLEAIFDPFTQMKGAGRPSEGAGLGLAICRNLIELMGGRLSVASEVGKGSTFTVELELEVAEAGEQEATAPEKVVIGYQGERKRLLIVDDNIINLSMLVSVLDPLGFAIETATSGEEALSKAAVRCSDLILLDLLMPGMDGDEALRRIRRTEGLEHVNVIGVSAAVADKERTEQFATACDGFLAKPVDIRALQEQLKEHLQIEWIEEEAEAAGTPVSTEVPPVDEGEPEKWPPQAIVDDILEKAERGDFTRLERILDRLEAEDEEYKGFCGKIRAYSKRFDDDAIMNELNQ